jgi:hypothetical protein
MILSANTVLYLKYLVPKKKILVKIIPGTAEAQ